METTVLSLPGGLDHVMQPDELRCGVTPVEYVHLIILIC